MLPGFSKLVNLVTPLANQPSAFLVVNLSKQHPSTSSPEIIENHRKQGLAGGIWWCLSGNQLSNSDAGIPCLDSALLATILSKLGQMNGKCLF